MTAVKILFAAMLCLPLLLLVFYCLINLVEDVLKSTENSANVRVRSSRRRSR